MTAEGTVFWNLKRYGAPLSKRGTPGRRFSLERTLAESVGLARRHPSVAQVWPVVLSRNRKSLRVRKLERLANGLGQGKALGFLLSVTGRLLGDRVLAVSERRLRKKASSEMEDFFLVHHGPFYRELMERRTPKEAKAWAFRMNTSYEDFESSFKKFHR